MNTLLSSIEQDMDRLVNDMVQADGKVVARLFPVQLLNARDADYFRIKFHHDLDSRCPGQYDMLFVAHGAVKYKSFYGQFEGAHCPVIGATLNGNKLETATNDARPFAFKLYPILAGVNDLVIFIDPVQDSNLKLAVRPYRIQLPI